MIAVGILTYLTRLSFILLLDKWQPPELVTQRAALRAGGGADRHHRAGIGGCG